MAQTGTGKKERKKISKDRDKIKDFCFVVVLELGRGTLLII
jgi:hypothetical protein